jgi:hypothetical protein
MKPPHPLRILFRSSWFHDDGLTRSGVDPASAALESLPARLDHLA